jgi:1,2-diacylglycerol 3-alpha-glucosyltransferase
MKIAIIWARFGPYHLARLRGAAEVAASRGASIVGIEIAQSDAIYEWEVINDDGAFKRLTLFSGRNYESLSGGEIGRAVVSALDAIAPDAVAINGWSVKEARAAIAWCARKAVRSIIMSESKEDDIPRTNWKEFLKRRIVRRYDSALVGGLPHAEYLRQLGFSGDIFIGYDVVDNHYFALETAKVRAQADRLRAAARLPERYFLACTRFIPRKNITGLLRAYTLYRHEIKQEAWGLVVAGSGEDQIHYHSLERELGLEGVVWPGFVQYNRLPYYYGLATAFIHPAISEPWGLVVNEAIASGLPILVSRNVGARYELLQEGENGFSFDPENIGELAGRMLNISQMTPETLAAMGQASSRIAQDWTPNRFGRMLLAAAGVVNVPTDRIPTQ